MRVETNHDQQGLRFPAAETVIAKPYDLALIFSIVFGAHSFVIPAQAGIQLRGDMERHYHVYILANRRNGTLYIGVTGNLIARILAHRNGVGCEFTRKYGVFMLVHVESFVDIRDAIAREKSLKKWNRRWKIRLIERANPHWQDLFESVNI